MKEFNLNDKKFYIDFPALKLTIKDPLLKGEDVKEFIKRLKEYLKLNIKCGGKVNNMGGIGMPSGTCGICISMCDKCSEKIDEYFEAIDKLAGNSLIELEGGNKDGKTKRNM